MLASLAELYDALAARDVTAPAGWGPAKVTLALSLNRDGTIQQIFNVMQEVAVGKKTELRPQVMRVPEPVIRAMAVTPNFLCDNAAYIFGIDSKGKPERARRCFNASKEHHLRLLLGVDSMAARAVTAFFEGWDPSLAQTHPLLSGHLDLLSKGGNIVFRVGGRYAHEDELIRKAWQTACESAADGEMGICSVSGEYAEIERLHPKIKNVRGSQSTGAALVSFNAEAYNSLGKEQGQNAQVGKRTAFRYGAALNYLLADSEHSILLGDTTVVFWAKGGQTAPQDMMACVLGSGKPADSNLYAALRRLADGLPARWENEDVSPDTPFYILGISPNAGRLSVRFFLRDTFGAFANNASRHCARLEIIRPAFDNRETLSVWDLLRETVNPNAREKRSSPAMSGDLLRAVLTGGRYPLTLLYGVILRIRAERVVNRGRAAIIKAYYLRNTHNDCPKEVLTVKLNEESTFLPYCLGQLFSVLEAIQQQANPGINSTITDKFFSSASASPARTFPHLVDLAQKHLRKMDTGSRIYYSNQLMGVMGKIREEYPLRLSLPEQGAFQLGYYHMTQKRYTKKEEK